MLPCFSRTDGAGLFCGLLTHLIARGADCPKVLAATHFHEVFRDDILNPHQLPVAFVHMQIMLTSSKGERLDAGSDDDGDDADDEDQEQLRIRPGEGITYLYKYANRNVGHAIVD